MIFFQTKLWTFAIVIVTRGPLNEVIHGYGRKAGFPLGIGPIKSSPPLCEQTRASHGGDVLGQLVGYVCEKLGRAASSSQVHGVSIYGRPKISSPHNLGRH